MKIQVALMIDDQNPKTVGAMAFGTDEALVKLTAGSWQEAAELMQTAQKAAEEALAAWKPEDQAHIEVLTPQQILLDRAEEWERTEAGQRYKKRIQKAVDFNQKHNKPGIRLSMLDYMACRCLNNFTEGFYEAYSLGYLMGYEKRNRTKK